MARAGISSPQTYPEASVLLHTAFFSTRETGVRRFWSGSRRDRLLLHTALSGLHTPSLVDVEGAASDLPSPFAAYALCLERSVTDHEAPVGPAGTMARRLGRYPQDRGRVHLRGRSIGAGNGGSALRLPFRPVHRCDDDLRHGVIPAFCGAPGLDCRAKRLVWKSDVHRRARRAGLSGGTASLSIQHDGGFRGGGDGSVDDQGGVVRTSLRPRLVLAFADRAAPCPRLHRSPG